MFIEENHNFKANSVKLWLSSPTMQRESKVYLYEAYDTNWMSTVGIVEL